MFLSIWDSLKNNKTTIIILGCVLCFFLSLPLFLIKYFIHRNSKDNKHNTIRRIVCISIYASLSIILYLTFKFPLPIFPSFLKINFSNLPILLASLMLGPVDGVIVVLVRTVIVLPFTGTAAVGETADFILSTSIALVSGLIYYKFHTKKGGLVAIGSSILTWVLMGMLANYILLAPAYIMLFFNGDESIFINMLSVIPNVNESNYMFKYIFYAILPFNLLLSTIVSIITMLVYKRLSFLFHKFDVTNEESEEEI